jgi:hypothetical protein
MTGDASSRQRGSILTAMFTDIVDSTRLKHEMSAETALGRDEAYRIRIKEPHDARVLEEGTSNGELQYRLAVPLVQERFVRQNLYRRYFRS